MTAAAMSKHRVAVLKVVSGQLSVTAAAAECHLSRGHLQRLLARYREEGLDSVEPRSRRPLTSPHAVPDGLRERIVALRTGLVAGGLDAGPATIAWHLAREGLAAPSTSTIRRVPRAAGLVVPEPHKRPRSSWIRSGAAQPNEAWQSDLARRRLADGSEVGIASWLDDHSRFLLGCTAFRRVSGHDVVATLAAAGDGHGWPAATLTDNGTVYTARLVGGRNGPGHLPARLGTRRRNGSPGHPQTQGKVERLHQTPRRWLGRQPAAQDLAALQAQLDAFRTIHDEQRPHRAIGRRTPGEAHRATPKARPAGPRAQGPFRLRHDTTDGRGTMTVRRAGRLHHLKVGQAHARTRVLAVVDEAEVTVVALETGEVLSAHPIDPARGHWRNTRRGPGRWPGPPATG